METDRQAFSGAQYDEPVGRPRRGPPGMSRLSALATSEAVAAFTVAGLNDARDYDALTEVLLLLRNRIRASPVAEDLGGQRLAIQRCVQPLVQWLEAEPDVAPLDVLRKVDLLWYLYLAAVSRTAMADSFPLICGNEETWNDTMAELFVAGPTVHHASTQRSRLRLGSPLWTLGLGLLGVGADQMLASGRWRFYLVMFSTMLVGMSMALWYYGYPLWYRSSMTSHAAEPPVLRPRPSSSSQQHVLPPAVQPPLAPPVPGGSAGTTLNVAFTPPGLNPGPGALATGTRVLLNGVGNTAPFLGLQGSIAGSANGGYDIDLDSGVRVARISHEGLTVVPADQARAVPVGSVVSEPMPGVNGVYAPYANSGSHEATKLQASRVRTSLDKSYALQSIQPAWGALFWQAVKNEADLHGLQGQVQKLLEAHGYVGPATVGPPRYDELKRQLTELETLGAVPHGAGGALLQAANSSAMPTDPERMAWHLRLPADLQRAGPEIYRNIRAEGVSSVRQWVNEQHAGLEARNTTQFQDLFTAATIIDFELADCRSELDLMSKLAVSDTLEIQLRKLGSFIYFRRTKDKNGALRMLGVRAPGTNADIAPKWMLDDANLFSKAEYQRLERGGKLNKLEHGGGHGAKGDGKGKRGGGRPGGRGNGKPPNKKGGQATQG